jgi:prolipoprotein diacylglyceryltransferase
MLAAFLPSPSRSVWHLGPLPLRAYALCLVAAVVLGIWVTDRRYVRAGGRPGVILDVATWAVPCGLVGARLYIVITEYERYFGDGHDWLGMFRISDAALGIPGALAAGALGAWYACRRAGIALAPVAGAAAPGLAFGMALGYWGNWFSQQLYGRPSSLPWAVEIAPAHRVSGYEIYATFQPTFLYGCLWDVLTGVLVIWAARRFLLTGDRVFALWLATFAVGRYGTEALAIDFAHYLFGLRINQWVMAFVFAGALGYLYLTRARLGPSLPAGPDRPPGRPRLAGGAGAGLPAPPGSPGPAGDPPAVPHLGRFGTRG